MFSANEPVPASGGGVPVQIGSDAMTLVNTLALLFSGAWRKFGAAP